MPGQVVFTVIWVWTSNAVLCFGQVILYLG